jgi:uncharacterized membrane protein HdeD (DUF308 family)
MGKKINYDKVLKKIEKATKIIEIIMRNRLIIALLLIIDGITIILNPNSSLVAIARSIILIVLLAAFSTLIANLCTRKKDIKSIIISSLILIIGIITYFYPDIISAYIQLLLSLFIIYDGLINILNVLNLNKISKYTHKISEKYEKVISQKKVNKDIDKELEVQGNKYIEPLKNIVGKTNKSSILYIIINLATIVLGIFLLFSSSSMIIWGIIFTYTGTSDLLVTMKTMDILTKIKEKKFKDILYDTNKVDSKQEQSNSTSNNK